MKSLIAVLGIFFFTHTAQAEQVVACKYLNAIIEIKKELINGEETYYSVQKYEDGTSKRVDLDGYYTYSKKEFNSDKGLKALIEETFRFDIKKIHTVDSFLLDKNAFSFVAMYVPRDVKGKILGKGVYNSYSPRPRIEICKR